MKKLLGIIGTFTLLSSASTSVVSCGPKISRTTIKDENVLEHSESLSVVLSQVTKGLFFNQNSIKNNEHISTNYILNNFVKDKALNDLGIDKLPSELSGDTKYNEVYEEFFDNSLFSEQIKLSDNIYQGTVLSPSNSTLSSINEYSSLIPMILNGLIDPSMLASLGSMVGGFLKPDLLASVANYVSNENLMLLEKAFSPDIYKDMSYQQAMDSSAIGLANAIETLLNVNSNKIFSYDNSDDVAKNFLPAIDQLGDNLISLIKGEKKLAFDIEKNMSTIAEILRFVRTLLLAIDSFTSDELTKSPLSLDYVLDKRKSKVTTNKININKLVTLLKKMTEDENGVILKNIINILLGTGNIVDGNDANSNVNKDENGAMSYLGDSNGGYVKVLTKILSKLINKDYLEIDIKTVNLKINVDYLLRCFIDTGLGDKKNLVSNLLRSGLITPGLILQAGDSLPDMFKNIIKSFDDKEWNKFKEDWIAYIWNNDNQTLNFSIKKLLNQPLKSIMESSLFSSNPSKTFNKEKNNSMDFLMQKSISEIANDLYESVKSSNATLNFDDVALLFKSLYEGNTLQNALKDPKNIFNILGLDSSSKKFKEGSPLYYLALILKENIDWIKNALTKVLSYIKTYLQELEEYNKIITEEFNNLKISKSKIQKNKFTYKVSNGKIVNKYEIQITQKNGLYLISEITLFD
ncbi:MOLPALP family lipoprotein [Spiroplasma apis]|uniref:MOLPALP family lipoprotein n=1 Tax=Spiroplasma apis B31 TaxID=1276258 RepID=V5RL41_SPIAP|nr:MOLPALP family lipoprotein [Spiroplasma apis]AHB36510.1 hypothetical protein SAPIS_v1c06650 [Spiroplasma apis B31]